MIGEFGVSAKDLVCCSCKNFEIPFICDLVKPRDTVLTDSWGGYSALKKNGGVDYRKVLLSNVKPAHVFEVCLGRE